MPERDWRLLLRDMLQHASEARAFCASTSRDEFLANRQLISAVTWQLVVIGEAASRLPPDVRAQMPNVPWQRIRGMRNHLIHDYPDNDASIMWETVEADLEELMGEIASVLSTLGNE